MKEVVIDINPDGTVKIEVNGAEGTECDALTEEIERALGGETTKTLKPEYRRAAKTKTRTVGR